MTPEDWQRLKSLLDGALKREAGARETYLREACGDDAEMFARAESLIASSEESWSGFEGGASGLTEPEERPRTGERIGAYEILEEIGHGGMGTVYLGRRADEEFRQQVAIKLVRRGMDTDFVLGRFRHERQILAGLDHPHIARLLDGGATADGRPYFVMEYVEGQPLLDDCDSRRLSIEERLKLFLDVCGAVQFAHQNLVVHRDIKPANVLVTAEGAVKLLDFGIAKVLNPEPSSQTVERTASVLRLMTPDYASPEQVRGEPITTATDVYSLGIVLYELLTGHRPYRVTSAEPGEVARVVCEQVPEKPSTAVSRVEEVSAGSERITLTPESVSRTREGEPQKLRRRLQGDLDNIVLMALRKEPQRRYASVGDLAEDIRRHLDGRPVRARKDTMGYRTGKFVRRHRAGVAAAALVLVALAAGLVWNLREARRARAAEARAERRFNDVRRLANSFLFEFHDAIQDLPGSTPARALVVKRALEYLDSLARESANDPGLQRELATAYQKVGDVLGKGGSANLGDTAGASMSYKKALEMRQALAAADPGNRALQLELAVTFDSVIEVARALAIRERLASTGDRDALRALQVSYHHLAAGEAVRKDFAKALVYRQKQAAVAETLWKAAPADPESCRNLALAYKYLGGTLKVMGRSAEACDFYRKAIALDEQRSAASPAGAEARLDLSFSYGGLADCLVSSGDLAGGLETYRKALAIREEVAAADPKNVFAQSSVASAQNKIGFILRRSGDFRSSLESYRSALETQRKLAFLDPSNTARQLEVATTLGNIGELHAEAAVVPRLTIAMRRERWTDAKASYQKNLEILAGLRREGKLGADNAAESDRIAAEISRCDAALKKR